MTQWVCDSHYAPAYLRSSMCLCVCASVISQSYVHRVEAGPSGLPRRMFGPITFNRKTSLVHRTTLVSCETPGPSPTPAPCTAAASIEGFCGTFTDTAYTLYIRLKETVTCTFVPSFRLQLSTSAAGVGFSTAIQVYDSGGDDDGDGR